MNKYVKEAKLAVLIAERTMQAEGTRAQGFCREGTCGVMKKKGMLKCSTPGKIHRKLNKKLSFSLVLGLQLSPSFDWYLLFVPIRK